mmetsp:Transcript_22960/g.80120  ORF Transcript_22960/g.80120 Transcript_22960/m.80120 type:complete len:255 (+) Transcript_22960:3600-4364(+)
MWYTECTTSRRMATDVEQKSSDCTTCRSLPSASRSPRSFVSSSGLCTTAATHSPSRCFTPCASRSAGAWPMRHRKSSSRLCSASKSIMSITPDTIAGSSEPIIAKPLPAAVGAPTSLAAASAASPSEGGAGGLASLNRSGGSSFASSAPPSAAAVDDGDPAPARSASASAPPAAASPASPAGLPAAASLLLASRSSSSDRCRVSSMMGTSVGCCVVSAPTTITRTSFTAIAVTSETPVASPSTSVPSFMSSDSR